MKGVETQFEEILVAEAEGAGEQAANFSVDAFHPSAGEPGFVVAQDSLGMAKEGLGHRMELSDAAGFCLGAPFAQESPGLGRKRKPATRLTPRTGRKPAEGRMPMLQQQRAHLVRQRRAEVPYPQDRNMVHTEVDQRSSVLWRHQRFHHACLLRFAIS
jgi:hypothetical protein